LSLKQANEDYIEEFDPSKYGMADSYDEQGNYIFPEGFDPETNEWLDGYESQRAEWEARYAEAERRHKMHTAQMEKFAAADDHAEAAEQPPANGSPREEESAGGSLASD
jgi:small subunit ribosomal protein S1